MGKIYQAIDTNVATAVGDRPISEIEPGDTVPADDAATGTTDGVTRIGTWANNDPAVVLTAVATAVRYAGCVTTNGCTAFAIAVDNQREQLAQRASEELQL